MQMMVQSFELVEGGLSGIQILLCCHYSEFMVYLSQWISFALQRVVLLVPPSTRYYFELFLV